MEWDRARYRRTREKRMKKTKEERRSRTVATRTRTETNVANRFYRIASILNVV